MKITQDKKSRHFTVGLNTLSGITLLLVWGMITGQLSLWWLTAVVPMVITALGFEIQEKSPGVNNSIRL